MRVTGKANSDTRQSREQKLGGKKTRRAAMLAAVAGMAGVSLASAQSSGEWRHGEAGSGAETGGDFKRKRVIVGVHPVRAFSVHIGNRRLVSRPPKGTRRCDSANA